MILPAAIGLLIPILILNSFQSILTPKGADFLSSEDNGRVLGVMEEVGHLPVNAYNYLYLKNYLPPSEDRPLRPSVRPGAVFPQILASSSLVLDKESEQAILERDSSSVRPIASITKLATALTFLDSIPDWEKQYKITKDDLRDGGKSYVYPGEEVKIKDLFHLLLVASDNTAAIALARSTGLSEAEFVAKMNEKAKKLGLKDTSFEDACGLSAKNVSAASEVALLAKKSFVRKNIREAALKKDYEFSTAAGRKVKAEATNDFLRSFPGNGQTIIGGKTGHTIEAGYCFVGEFVNGDGREVISVVLGAPAPEGRFEETKKLIDWVFANVSWQIAN